MKLLGNGCKRTIHLIILAFMLCLGFGAIGASAEGSVQYDDTNMFFFRSWIRDTVSSPECITVRATISIRGEQQPAGAEIYRAALTANGSQGKYRKVGVCKNLKRGRNGNWRFSYRDNTVKTGQRYIYKCKGFVYDGAVKIVQKNNCLTGTGIAEKSPEGNYTCKIIKNTKKKLIVKVAGVSKKCIGVLSPATSNPAYQAGWLACKNSGNKEVCYALTPEAYSFDGEKWKKKWDFEVTGKKNIYFRFSGNGIDISQYQYAQLIVEQMKNDMCSGEKIKELRLNLTGGTGKFGNFLEWDGITAEKGFTKWAGQNLKCNLNTVKYKIKYNKKLKVSHIVNTLYKPGCITLEGYIEAKDMPDGAEIYRASVDEYGNEGIFKQIAVCKKFKPGKYVREQWSFKYQDTKVETGMIYVYQFRAFTKKKKSTLYQEDSFGPEKVIAANAVGEYTCKVTENTKEKLVIKLMGKNEGNGFLEYLLSKAIIVFKNERGAEETAKAVLEAYSYDGTEWSEELMDMAIKETESVYLRFSRDVNEETDFKDFSDYQYAQMMLSGVRYNRYKPKYSIPNESFQLRLNLVTNEGTAGRYIVRETENSGYYITKWDKDLFECNIWGGYIDYEGVIPNV